MHGEERVVEISWTRTWVKALQMRKRNPKAPERYMHFSGTRGSGLCGYTIITLPLVFCVDFADPWLLQNTRRAIGLLIDLQIRAVLKSIGMISWY